jgi:membrane associated rhomboid family serine protease
MVIPYGDNVESRGGKPWGTYALIALCLLVFAVTRAVELTGVPVNSLSDLLTAFNPESREWLYETFSVVPSLMSQAGVPGDLLRIVAATFMHDGWYHLLTNMTGLWAYGRSLELLLGTRRFVAFFLASSLVGYAAQWLLEPTSNAAFVGASGAIMAVVMLYLLCFPKARVNSVFFVPVLNIPVPLPALPVWVLLPAGIAVGKVWELVLMHVVNVVDSAHLLTPPPSMVAGFVHAGGALFGIIAAGAVWWSRKRWPAVSYTTGGGLLLRLWRIRWVPVVLGLVVLGACDWALETQVKQIAAETQQALEASKDQGKHIDSPIGGFDEETSHALADQTAGNLDVKKLRAAIEAANKELPGAIATLNGNPDILDPFSKACRLLHDSAKAFKDAGSNNIGRNAAAQSYLIAAREAGEAFTAVMAGPHSAQIQTYIDAESSLGIYFGIKADLSKPILVPSAEEASAQKLLAQGFKLIFPMRESVQESVRLAEIPDPAPSDGLSVGALRVQTRLNQLDGHLPCEPLAQ